MNFILKIRLFFLLLMWQSGKPQMAGERTAVCISGQLRSANFSWSSPLVNIDWIDSKNGHGLPINGPPTTAENIIEWMLKPLANAGGVDVFMYVEAHGDDKDHVWDGTPENFKPKVGDPEACNIFAKSEIFAAEHGNNFFCLVEDEKSLMTGFIHNDPRWGSYYFAHAPQYFPQLLAQLYGIYRANLGAQQYAMQKGFQYKYKIRARPDEALLQPLPNLTTLDFGPRGTNCKGTVLYSPFHEDKFNVGLSDEMDRQFERYLEFISKPEVHSVKFPKYPEMWNAEAFLVGTLTMRHGICFEAHPAISTVTVRVKLPQPSGEPWVPPSQPDWLQIQGKSTLTSEQMRLKEIAQRFSSNPFKPRGWREIYLFDNNSTNGLTKRAIPNWDTFLAMHLAQDSILEMSVDDFNAFPTGDPWPSLSY